VSEIALCTEGQRESVCVPLTSLHLNYHMQKLVSCKGWISQSATTVEISPRALSGSGQCAGGKKINI